MSKKGTQPTTSKYRKHALVFDEPSLTKQAFAGECNINNIMARYEQTGIIDHTKSNPGAYGDFTNIKSYQESLNQIMLAQNLFDELPSKLRQKFDNDPVKFVEFCSDEKNQEQMVQMGLSEAPKIPQEPLSPKTEDIPKEKEEAPSNP